MPVMFSDYYSHRQIDREWIRKKAAQLVARGKSPANAEMHARQLAHKKGKYKNG